MSTAVETDEALASLVARAHRIVVNGLRKARDPGSPEIRTKSLLFVQMTTKVFEQLCIEERDQK
jgi:hypothetical protein